MTDSILAKIKRKIIDVNKKIKDKYVSLYCYLLTLDFWDCIKNVCEKLYNKSQI